jgi:hypothetical protein
VVVGAVWDVGAVDCWRAWIVSTHDPNIRAPVQSIVMGLSFIV